MAVEKFSISLSPETLSQMDYIRECLGLIPDIKRSQLISQIIFDDYSKLTNTKINLHGTSWCKDDCKTCKDTLSCDYFYIDD